MRAEERVYATRDGELVGEGDPSAAVLRYAVGDEVAKADEAAVKKLAKPADKARRPTQNKSAD